MMERSKYLQWFLAGAVTIALTACGNDNNNTGTVASEPTAQEIAIDKIADFAQDGTPVPTVDDYLAAGVRGVNPDNIDEINSMVEGLTYEDVDTDEEIQALADQLGVTIVPPPTTVSAEPEPAPEPNEEEGDILPPHIQLIGELYVEVVVDSIYTDAGAVALDNIDGHIDDEFISVVSDVNTSEIGRYYVTYTATDSSGNQDSITRTVDVVALPVKKELVGGIHRDLSIAKIESLGWSECYKSIYSRGNVTDMLSSCTKAKIMLACRVTDSDILQLAAYANHDEVFQDTGKGVNTVHTANDVDWYFSTRYSMGFAPVGARVYRFSADVNSSGSFGNPIDSTTPYRLSWHTNGNSEFGGWRCGADVNLNNSDAFEKVIYQAD